jgi:protein TonB
MREIFKAYSLSFLIHSLLLFGFFLLTQRLVPPEKRLIEIDLSLENLQRQPHADLLQKAQPLPARPLQTQPVPQATIPPTKEEIKSLAVKKIEQEERLIQAQSPPNPAEAEIREIQTSQVQTTPQLKEETKSQTAKHPVQGEMLLQAKEISQKPASQGKETEGPKPADENKNAKEEIKSSTAKQLKQEERQSQVQSPPKPAEAEIREVQTSQVQTAPQPKEETKGQTAEHPGQGERLLQAKEISQKPASQEREAEGPKPADENKNAEESFLRERLSVISNIVQRHINYPPIARRMGWEGRALIGFVLEPNGDIRDLKVLKSCGYEVLDKEALDAIRRSYKDFPKPPVSVMVKLPINFRLE